MIILDHTHEKEFAFRQALAPDYFMSLVIVPEKPQWGGSIKNVCLYTECMFVYMTPYNDALLWQPYMMQTTVELNCSRSIKSSNKLNRSAEPNSKL